MRKIALALALIVGSLASPVGFLTAPGWAQAPPPVPAEPDAERRTRYTGVSNVTTFNVGFDIYGDGTDYTAWIEVWVNGVNVPAASNWSLVPAAGSFTTLSRPLLAANLNVVFTAGQSGTVDIVGARRPRRTSQLLENRGVSARDFNQIVTDLWMTLRETWDRTNDLTGRAIIGVPGDTLVSLPPASVRAGQFLCFDRVTGQPTMCAGTAGAGSFQAGNGILFTGSNPTTVSASLQAGTGISISATNPPVISRVPVPTRAATSSDTSSSSDCNKVILASGGFTTLTLPAASTVPAGCEIGYKNNEVYSGIGTGRGKKMVNFPADFSLNNIIYPAQAGKVVSDGTNWYTSVRPGRWLIPTTVELCVRQDGSTTSDGLGNGTVAADCLSTIQQAVTTIGYQWDGGGYNACAIGVYPGGTSIINESVSQTGQSVGCYLTLNWRGGSIKWTNSGPCWTAGDGSIAVFNFNINASFVPILQCNTSNVALTGQFYGHQQVIYDINGALEWIPGGSNDDLVVMDAQGRATIGLSGSGMIIGDALTRAGNSILNCNYGCRGLQISGAVNWSPNVTMNKIFIAKATSLINSNASFAGSATVAGPSIVDGNSVLTLNGTTPPGGTITPTHGGQSF